MSDAKRRAILETGKLEHQEEKIIYQFVIGAVISISVAIIAGVIQNHLSLVGGIAFLIGFYNISVLLFLFVRKRMKRIRFNIIKDINKLEKE